MTNYNAYIHSTKAFGGKPIRRREIDIDFSGYVAELLAKATAQDKLDAALTRDEKDGLLQILRSWGALDKNYEYRKSDRVSELRGYKIDPGGELSPHRSIPIRCRWASCSPPTSDLLRRPLLRLSDPVVRTGRRHGHDRQGLCPAAGRTDPI